MSALGAHQTNKESIVTKKTTDQLQKEINGIMSDLDRLNKLKQPTDCPFKAKQQLEEIKNIRTK
ncbi:MAG: hypothetical protein AAGA46_00210 [Cyanobacteria bacterium P01_F01_bin.13]